MWNDIKKIAQGAAIAFATAFLIAAVARLWIGWNFTIILGVALVISTLVTMRQHGWPKKLVVAIAVFLVYTLAPEIRIVTEEISPRATENATKSAQTLVDYDVAEALERKTREGVMAAHAARQEIQSELDSKFKKELAAAGKIKDPAKAIAAMEAAKQQYNLRMKQLVEAAEVREPGILNDLRDWVSGGDEPRCTIANGKGVCTLQEGQAKDFARNYPLMVDRPVWIKIKGENPIYLQPGMQIQARLKTPYRIEATENDTWLEWVINEKGETAEQPPINNVQPQDQAKKEGSGFCTIDNGTEVCFLQAGGEKCFTGPATVKAMSKFLLRPHGGDVSVFTGEHFIALSNYCLEAVEDNSYLEATRG